MNLTQAAIRDVAAITGNGNDFGVSILLNDNNGNTATVNGIHTQHHLKINPESGDAVNVKHASVAIHEDNIVSANADYPVRTDGRVKMQGHLVDVTDSSGATTRYRVNENHADEKVGLIVLILGEYE